MMFNCEYCDEEACVELTEGRVGYGTLKRSTSIHGVDYFDCFVLKCHNPECGVQEPCDGDELWGCLVQITGEKDWHKAMVKALQIVWKEMHMKEVKE